MSAVKGPGISIGATNKGEYYWRVDLDFDTRNELQGACERAREVIRNLVVQSTSESEEELEDLERWARSRREELVAKRETSS